ncbi:formate dehydrogenase subunit gamma [Marinobacter sp. DSM 26671]|jgi:formate dehydrogenase subunit gamma|uniref:Formate dehydrogenase subunit gamma n=3 Tax=Marinobacter TaxID=2742 RepID=A0A3D8H3K1_9GAMM|nr:MULTISPECIES: formate dehydrogenase subunit gamma [Marinobacter]MCP4062135.1 formate dehydrogenase subunit gamma [Gammaproteobacteria bacterium]HAP51674.1 formate dehydrogenase subunit gamma [Marinobacter adhaerens]EHJ02820.1 formate dehydrogenase, gamma subunit [Marinobacter manganoxydans MnI7-9]MAK51794.1 formate dehydrogenase subunit gamma [Marinobacter sp.]MAM52069.1 formate dehydrogenase subunit gamma [Marinobacter sp.]|tara:strand:- start:7144 stop:8316 length:1173 start_codon:yes stop_codon:yes gene_type:complete
MKRKLLGAVVLALATLVFNPVWAQEAPAVDRTSTGGAQTLEDILARQKQLEIDESFRSENLGNPANAAPISGRLGTLGGRSDSDIYRAIRYNKIDPSTQARGPAADVLIQDGGIPWYKLREGPVITYGGSAILAIIALLAVFYFVRGRIKITGGPAGTTVERFKAIERFGHWLLAGSFVALAITGLITLMGRSFLIPVMGPEAFATLAAGSKWLHNNIAWAFMLGLVMTFFMWVAHNIPNKLDWQWLKVGGGIFTNAHPSARKFNAGQKIVFWTVMLLGFSVSLSGLSLLFPFEIPMFAKTFGVVNTVLGTDLPTVLTPHEEMQYANIWHSIVAFVMMLAIIAHIYIGSVGMEGAFDAMGNGQVDLEWARQHHDLWVAEVEAKQGKGGSS